MTNEAPAPRAYVDPAHYLREQRALARGCWHLAALARDVPEHNDHVTVRLAGRSVTLQNFRGEVRAFENVCTHRYAQMRDDGCRGNGPLRCPYHGWTYDAEGLPSGVPHKGTLPTLAEPGVREGLSLARWSLARCGELLFVRAHRVGDTHEARSVEDSLRAYLGSFYAPVEALSAALGEEVDRYAFELAADWKISLENTLESYHVDLVHPESFRRLGLTGEDFAYSENALHSSWRAGVGDGTRAGWARVEKQLAGRPYITEGYEHWLLYPSATVATTFGGSFALQRFEPRGVGRSWFETRTFATRAGGRGEALARALARSAAEFNRAVFDEDKSVCERVQRGTEQRVLSGEGERRGVLGTLEDRVAAFHAACAVLVETYAADTE